MQYWLVKSEPNTWSWDDHWDSPDRTESWDGVRNHQAKNNMKAMKLGDRAFFYHSVKARTIVGVCEIVGEAYPDPTDESGRFVQVDLRAIGPMPEPVTLAQIKAEEGLEDMVLVRNSRLSVQPVTEDEWQKVCELGGWEEPEGD